MMPVGRKATKSLLMTSKLRNFLQYSATTERIAPSWMMISKLFTNSLPGSPSAWLARIRWAVDETGRNSVIPSMTPRIRAWRRDIESVREVSDRSAPECHHEGGHRGQHRGLEQ